MGKRDKEKGKRSSYLKVSTGGTLTGVSAGSAVVPGKLRYLPRRAGAGGIVGGAAAAHAYSKANPVGKRGSRPDPKD